MPDVYLYTGESDPNDVRLRAAGVSGSGELTQPAATLDGTAVERFIATGAITGPVATVTAAGTVSSAEPGVCAFDGDAFDFNAFYACAVVPPQPEPTVETPRILGSGWTRYFPPAPLAIRAQGAITQRPGRVDGTGHVTTSDEGWLFALALDDLALVLT